MEITYVLEPEDLWRYNKFVINRIPAFKARFGFRLVVVPLGLFFLFTSLRFPLWLSCIFELGSAAVWIPFCCWSARQHHYRLVREQPGLLGKRILKIGPDGVRQVTDHADTLLQWSSFTEIAESSEQIYLFMNRRFAIVIPKRAFMGLEGAQAFLEASRNYRAGLDVKVPTFNGVWPPPPRMGG